jgi:hypothetical protein
MLVGGAVDHYDVMADAARWAVADRVHVTGYVPDASLADYLLAADVCACLRWPTNRETSASWLRCLAAERPTLVSGLSDLVDVPALDPRGWAILDTSPTPRRPSSASMSWTSRTRCGSPSMSAHRRAPGRDLSVSARPWASEHQLSMMADGLWAPCREPPLPFSASRCRLICGRRLYAGARAGGHTRLAERVADVFPI